MSYEPPSEVFNRVENLTVVPNPAFDYIVIDNLENYIGGDIIIANIYGQKLITTKVSADRMRFNISEATTGVNFVYVIRDESTSALGKFVKLKYVKS